MGRRILSGPQGRAHHVSGQPVQVVVEHVRVPRAHALIGGAEDTAPARDTRSRPGASSSRRSGAGRGSLERERALPAGTRGRTSASPNIALATFVLTHEVAEKRWPLLVARLVGTTLAG